MPGTRKKEVNCILCGRKKLKVLTKRLRNNEPGIVRYCPDCDFGMIEDNKAPSELSKWYDGEYRKTHKLMPDKEYTDYQMQRVKLLMPYLNKDTVLLDAGCSTGHFMGAVQPYVKRVVGVDYDTTAVITARKTLECDVYNGDLEDVSSPDELFNVITAIHVLEHTYDPIRFLELVKRNLKPGGMVYVEVPNMNNVINVVYKSEGFKDVLFHRAHRWYFTPKSLAIIMEEANFSGIPVSLNMYNVLNHISWILTDTPMDMEQAIREPVLPVANDVPEEIKNDLQGWITDTNIAYKDILLRHGISGEIGFIGYLN